MKCHVRQVLAFSIGIIRVPDEKQVEEFELKYGDDGEKTLVLIKFQGCTWTVVEKVLYRTSKVNKNRWFPNST